MTGPRIAQQLDADWRWVTAEGARVHTLAVERPVYVANFARDPAAGARFARLFTSTWQRLPRRARAAILGHWASVVVSQAPDIRLSPIIALMPADRFRCGIIAVVACQGHELAFCDEIARSMPDEVVATMVAHELAHVCQHACGVRSGSAGEFEREADALAASWGYDVAGVSGWLVDHGIWATHAGGFADYVIANIRFQRTGVRWPAPNGSAGSSKI